MRSDRRGGPQQIPRPDLVRPGPATPWPWVDHVTTADIAAAVGAHRPEAIPAPSVDGHPQSGRGRPSAVLCAAFDEDGQARLVLTRRSSRLRSHTGEVSFPGGRLDDGETAIDAALREAHEEVGLDPDLVTPVGRLSALTTSISPALITPIVATLAARPVLVANPDEVDRVFTTTLVDLVAPGVHHSEIWRWTDGIERQIEFFELDGDTVWGATARMLSELLDWVVGPASPAEMIATPGSGELAVP